MVFIVCKLFGFACRLRRKNEEALLSPVGIEKRGNKRRAFRIAYKGNSNLLGDVALGSLQGV
jgi:hypothetical protein